MHACLSDADTKVISTTMLYLFVVYANSDDAENSKPIKLSNRTRSLYVLIYSY